MKQYFADKMFPIKDFPFCITHRLQGTQMTPHTHDFIEFTYVLQGTCEHNFNGTISTIKPGEAFLLVPTDNHQYLKNYSNGLY